MQSDHPLVICLAGPTAAGKTALAIELAKRHPVELVSVDSALVYRGLDIGAARPEPELLAQFPHRLMNLRDPSEPYSAADFCVDAKAAIRDIHAAGHVPLLVGGTMLYFKALLGGLADLPPADARIRARLAAEARATGWPALHARLAEVDPETAARLAPNDQQRLQRALEVFELTGITLSAHHRRQGLPASVPLSDTGVGGVAGLPYNARVFAVAPASRKVLHERIALRFRHMLEQGFEAEVRRLYERGDLSPDLPAIRAVGYRQMWDYLAGDCDYTGAVERALAATRQLAKRQLTWLRAWPDLVWLVEDDEKKLMALGLERMGKVLSQHG